MIDEVSERDKPPGAAFLVGWVPCAAVKRVRRLAKGTGRLGGNGRSVGHTLLGAQKRYLT